MARRLHLIQNAFTTGEVSPLLYGRTELDQYSKGCKTVQNFYVHPHGGVTRRPGLRYVTECYNSAKPSRLIPFEFSAEQAYVLEFSHEAIRVFMDGGVIEVGGLPMYILSPYDADDVFDIQFAQSADVLYLAHPGYKPRQLTRTAHDAWSLTTWSPTDDPFTSVNAYPRAVGIYQQRLWWGGTNTLPQTVWGTKSGDFDDMTIGVDDADAVQFTLYSNTVNTISWLLPTTIMFIGTAGGEFTMAGGGLHDPITPTNVVVEQTTKYGCANIPPIRAENAILFVQRAGKKMRELTYTLDEDSYIAGNVNILSEHLTASGIIDTGFEPEPIGITWSVMNGGALVGMTYEKQHKVNAWYEYTTQGDFESVATIPHPDGGKYQTWVVAKRNINGTDYRFMEYFDDTINVDSGLTYNGPATTTVSGLDHLAFEMVDLVGMVSGTQYRAVFPQQAVSAGGEITLSAACTYIEAGLHYDSTLQTLTPELIEMGTIQDNTMSWSKVVIRVQDTVGLSVNGNTIPFRTGGMAMGTGVEPYTGLKDISLESTEIGWGNEGVLTFLQEYPLDCTIIMFAGELTIGDQ